MSLTKISKWIRSRIWKILTKWTIVRSKWEWPVREHHGITRYFFILSAKCKCTYEKRFIPKDHFYEKTKTRRFHISYHLIIHSEGKIFDRWVSNWSKLGTFQKNVALYKDDTIPLPSDMSKSVLWAFEKMLNQLQGRPLMNYYLKRHQIYQKSNFWLSLLNKVST